MSGYFSTWPTFLPPPVPILLSHSYPGGKREARNGATSCRCGLREYPGAVAEFTRERRNQRLAHAARWQIGPPENRFHCRQRLHHNGIRADERKRGNHHLGEQLRERHRAHEIDAAK